MNTPCTGLQQTYAQLSALATEGFSPECVQCVTGGIWLMQLPVRAVFIVCTGLLRRCWQLLEAVSRSYTSLVYCKRAGFE